MRVVVADDVMLTRAGIVWLLRDARVDVVAEAEDAETLLQHVRSMRPDVAVVDIRMPPTHTDEGLVAARAIRNDHPEVGVLVLSQYVEPSYAMRLVEDQPERVGYLLKDRVADIALVVDALRRIVDGETVIGARTRGARAHRRRMSNKAIAGRLYVTERTVEAHVTDLPEAGSPWSPDQHRRVLSVLAFLRST